jgi:hypothetical protein
MPLDDVGVDASTDCVVEITWKRDFSSWLQCSDSIAIIIIIIMWTGLFRLEMELFLCRRSDKAEEEED